MPEIKLKPCPFCGREVTTNVLVARGTALDCVVFAVRCPTCRIQQAIDIKSHDNFEKAEKSMQKAIEAWNNRAEEIPLPVEYEGDGYDDNGEIIYDTAYCPNCRNEYEVDYDYHDNYCRKCGQKLDWGTENETD